MEISMMKEGSCVVVAVSGRLDAVTAPEFEKEMTGWIGQGEKSVAVNMAGLDYISSAGLRVILASAKKLKGVGGKLALSGLAESVREVFRISGFDAIIPICETVEKAKEAV